MLIAERIASCLTAAVLANIRAQLSRGRRLWEGPVIAVARARAVRGGCGVEVVASAPTVRMVVACSQHPGVQGLLRHTAGDGGAGTGSSVGPGGGGCCGGSSASSAETSGWSDRPAGAQTPP